MRGKVSIFLCMVMLLAMLSVNVGASEYQEGAYLYSIDNESATILFFDSKNSESDDIAIPDTLGGYPVTRIDAGAFENCTKLTSIVIPDSVTYIGQDAFRECSKLKQIRIPEGVTQLNGGTFWGCSSLENIILPQYMTMIGVSEFENCGSLVKFIVPEGVSKICDHAFASCGGLEVISIPNSVTEIDSYVFDYVDLWDVYYDGTEEEWNQIDISEYNNEGLEYATIHYMTDTYFMDYRVDEWASLYRDDSDSTVWLAEDLSAGTYKYRVETYEDYEISSVTVSGEPVVLDKNNEFEVTVSQDTMIRVDCMPATLYHVNYEGAYENGSLFRGDTEIFVEEELKAGTYTYQAVPDDGYTVASVTANGQQVIVEDDNAFEVEISGDTVIEITFLPISNEEDVFTYSVENGEVTIIAVNRAAEGILEIPDEINGFPVTKIGDKAIMSCSEIIEVSISATVESIGTDNFWNCPKLKKINVSEENPYFSSQAHNPYCGDESWEYRVDEWIDGILYDKAMTTLIAFPPACDHREIIEKGAYWIPDGVKTIKQGAFNNNSILTYIGLPVSLECIEDFAFYNLEADLHYWGREAEWNTIEFASNWNTRFSGDIYYYEGPPASYTVSYEMGDRGSLLKEGAAVTGQEVLEEGTYTYQLQFDDGYEVDTLSVTSGENTIYPVLNANNEFEVTISEDTTIAVTFRKKAAVSEIITDKTVLPDTVTDGETQYQAYLTFATITDVAQITDYGMYLNFPGGQLKLEGLTDEATMKLMTESNGKFAFRVYGKALKGKTVTLTPYITVGGKEATGEETEELIYQ